MAIHHRLHREGIVRRLHAQRHGGAERRDVLLIADHDGRLAQSGEAAIMVRYQEYVSTFRATVPLGVKTPDYTFPVQTVVDRHTAKKWKDLGLVPSELC